MSELKEGDMYLTIQLLGGSIKVVAFKNKDKEKNQQAPDYKGDGVAIWKNYKKAKQTEENI